MSCLLFMQPAVYSVVILTMHFLRPLEVASSSIVPGFSDERTIAVIIPLKTFICGFWNDSNDTGLPFAPAQYVPAPFTLNFIYLSYNFKLTDIKSSVIFKA